MKNKQFVPEDYHFKKYERRGLILSVVFHLLIISPLFINLKFFSKKEPIKQQKVIEIELIGKEHVIAPKSESKHRNEQIEMDNKHNKKTRDYTNDAALSRTPTIEEKDFYEDNNTTLPFEKIDFETIRKKVLTQLTYPAVAKENKWEGTIQLALTIDTSGELVGIRIGNPAKQQIFNDTVLLAMEKIKNDIFPKPSKTSTLLFDIEFSL